MEALRGVRAACFDWGGTLMSEVGPQDIPMAHWPEVHAIPGAAECLESLSGRLPLCIATNASVSRKPMIQRALERVDMASYFSAIFCYTELGFRKDQPGFWAKVAEELGLPLTSLAMIGDSFEQDYEAPRSCGVQAVWFNPEGQARGVRSVSDLREFSRMVLNAV